MRKLKLILLTALTMLISGGGNLAWAVTGTELTATQTDVFLYNVGAGKYLTGGDWWGTHATVSSAGMDLNLTKVSDNVYTIGTRQKGSQFLSGVWMDGGSMEFTFTEVDSDNHYYTISRIDGSDTRYLRYNNNTVEDPTTTPDGNTYYWQVVTRADFIASLSGATQASPKDATGAIYNAGFFCLDYATVKNADFPATRSWQGTQLTDIWGYRTDNSGVNGCNYCVEQYGKNFDNYQTLTSMPNGAYILKNQGFNRIDNSGQNPAYLYLNDTKVEMERITSLPEAPDGYTGNALQQASYWFGIGDTYHNTNKVAIVTDGTIRVGVTSDSKTSGWACFDNFTLSYLGAPSATNGIDMTEYITNPSFSSAYTTGWTLDGTAPNDYNSTYGTYEAYHRVGGLHQALTGLPNGVYKVTMQAAVRVDGGATGSFNLFATTSNGTTKSPATVAAHTNFATMAETMANDASLARIETYAIVTDGNLTIGHYESNNMTWPVFDNYTLTYYGTGSDAYALAMASEATKAALSITAMSTGSMKTAMNSAYTTKSADPTLANIQWMTFVSNSKSELVEASNLGIAADAIADVVYKQTVSDSHFTYTDAISTFQSSVTSATTTDAITTAMSTLKSAIKTYIAGAEPADEGDYFDITCLMTNPSFDNNTTVGWTCPAGVTNTSYTCNEFYQKSFDIYQTVTGLPTGSYTLSVQAFQRPGNAQTVYTDYMGGTNNATTLLYVNSTTAKAKHIAADAQTTAIGVAGTAEQHAASTVPYDSYVTYNEEGKYLPNSMQGARGYFDAGLYDATVAALVDDRDEGSLKLGFKSDSYVSGDWTIFDNFRLRYYGSSKMIYYKQYLPQLEAEIAENYLNNGAYSVLKTGQTERAALVTANSADADELDTEDDLQDAIDAITSARDNFVAAKTAYDNLTAATTAYTYNVGDGVFQMSSSQKTTFDGEVSTASTMYSTGTASKSDVEAQITAIANAYVLNAPDAKKRYVLTFHSDGHDADGNAITFIAGGRSGEGNYGLKYLAPSNANLNQAIKFTAVAGETNTYKVSGINVSDGGERYITTRAVYDDEDADKNIKLRTTDDASKAMWVKIEATSTSGQFQMRNVTANAIIAHNGNNNNDMFTRNSANFTIAEASQASVAITINIAVKYATRIFPFTPSLPSGVTAYSCTASDGDVLTLEKVETPQANTPYILEAPEGCASTDLKGWGTASASEYPAGWLTGVYTERDATNGTYVLQNNGGKVGFYKVDTSVKTPTVGAYRCYLTVPEGARPAFFFSDETTGIGAINALTSGSATIYSVDGHKLPALQKGLNIIKTNVKTYKVMVK